MAPAGGQRDLGHMQHPLKTPSPRRPAAILAAMTLLAALIAAPAVPAGETVIAVAANFAPAARALAERFAAGGDAPLVLAFGSSGKLYAQVVNGAPYAAFLSADAERPGRLEAEGRTVAGSRFTYALGRLVLWSRDPALVDDRGEVLRRGEFRRIAIANPRLAPYGAAAREVLRGKGAWEALQGRVVRGESVGQALQFVRSGNAELGFVARAQLRALGVEAGGSAWEVPAALHAPIVQQAVLLDDDPTARAFLAFVRGEQGRAVIASLGYGLP